MKTDIKNFPRGLDEKDLLYLIWKRLGEMGGSSDGGSDSSDSEGGGCECDPVEANPTIDDGDETTPLQALKVGESVYTVGGGLAPMIVEGTAGENGFVPVSGAPTWAEAMDYMFRGGLVYMLILADGEPVAIALADFADFGTIYSSADGETLRWLNPDEGGEGGEGGNDSVAG